MGKSGQALTFLRLRAMYRSRTTVASNILSIRGQISHWQAVNTHDLITTIMRIIMINMIMIMLLIMANTNHHQIHHHADRQHAPLD